MDEHKPIINANEVLLKENENWLAFSNPYRVLQAKTNQEVIPALRELEELIKVKGWYAAGFLSYEAAPAFDSALRAERSDNEVEAQLTGFHHLWFGLYPEPRLLSLPEPASPKETLSWLPTIDRASYNPAIAEIKSRIAHGLTYQVNFTMRLRTSFQADPWNFFLHLAQTQNNHAAYIDMGRYVICSASPELFFQLDGETITCRPMKGTMPRGRTTLEDQGQAQALKDSEKNRAENVMIVDMIRNDLGRIARVGTVHVPELFTVEKYPTLWQMTSTITAKTNVSLTDIFKALFPCASITGAPKVSTMRIISALETTSRKIYTGCIGYIAPNRKATFNVAIRTALIDRATQTAEYGVGGGIIWDSTSADEYAEALLKARVLTETAPLSGFSLLETMLWTPEEGFFLREKHILRLLDSADYFDFTVSREKLEDALDGLAPGFISPQRVRLLVDRAGNIKTECKMLNLLSSGAILYKVHLADRPINSNDVFLYHKTTQRTVYEFARKSHPDCDDVLLFNEHGELTEFTIGNLVVEMADRLFTPPVSCGLLAGTFRAHLLETGQVEERIIRVKDLEKCSKVFLVNSVRKWQEVRLV